MNEWASIDASGHVHDLLSEYLNGDLPSDGRQIVEQHLNECAECRRDFQSLRATVQILRQLPPRPVPRSFAIPTSESRWPRQLTWLRMSTGALAATFVLLLALQYVLPSAVRVPSNAPVAEFATGGARSALQATTAAAPAAPTALPAARPAPVNQSAGASASEAAQPVRDLAAPLAAPAPTEAPAAPLAAAAQVATASNGQKPASVANASADQSSTAREVANGQQSSPSPPPALPTQVDMHKAVAPEPQARAILAPWYLTTLVVIGVLALLSLVSLVLVSRRPV